MGKVVIVGAEGVGNVVTHKCARDPATFTEILLKCRTGKERDETAADVKAATGVELKLGRWNRPGVSNVEWLDPDPFKDDLKAWGLPWHVLEVDQSLIP